MRLPSELGGTCVPTAATSLKLKRVGRRGIEKRDLALGLIPPIHARLRS